MLGWGFCELVFSQFSSGIFWIVSEDTEGSGFETAVIPPPASSDDNNVQIVVIVMAIG